jgi:hypothetical protein
MQKQYISPQVRELGSITELTQNGFNKTGGGTDQWATQQNGLAGSIFVPAP